MSRPDIKWHCIQPGWYRGEILSPTGLTVINIERRTRYRIYACRIRYPDGSTWATDHESLARAKLACEIALILAPEDKLGWPKTSDAETEANVEERTDLGRIENQDETDPGERQGESSSSRMTTSPTSPPSQVGRISFLAPSWGSRTRRASSRSRALCP